MRFLYIWVTLTLKVNKIDEYLKSVLKAGKNQ